jgi:hypothetical protein
MPPDAQNLATKPQIVKTMDHQAGQVEEVVETLVHANGQMTYAMCILKSGWTPEQTDGQHA